MNINAIKILCNENKTSLKDLAIEIGISEQGLHGIIRNGDMKVSTLQAIADYFQVPITFFFEDGEPNTDMKDRVVDEVFEELKKLVKGKIR